MVSLGGSLVPQARLGTVVCVMIMKEMGEVPTPGGVEEVDDFTELVIHFQGEPNMFVVLGVQQSKKVYIYVLRSAVSMPCCDVM